MHLHPFLMLSLCSLFWSGNVIVGRALHEVLTPLTFSFWRWLTALAILLPFALPGLIAQWRLIRAHLLPLTLLGVLGVAGFNTFLYLGLQYTSATNALLINATTPLFIIVLNRLFYAHRLSPVRLVGLLLSTAGVAYIAVAGSFERLIALRFNQGDLWVVAASLVWAIYSVVLHWKPAELRELPFQAWNMIAGMAVLTPLHLSGWFGEPPLEPTPAVVGAILYVGLFASVLAYLFWSRGIKAVGPAIGGQFLHLIPLFGTLMAILFLGERLAPFHLSGALLIAGGLYLTLGRRFAR